MRTSNPQNMGQYFVSTDYWIRKLQVTNAYWEFKKCMQAKNKRKRRISSCLVKGNRSSK